MTDEPSVLDYVKSKLTPWKSQKIEIPAALSEEEQWEESPQEPGVPPEPKALPVRGPLPWRSFMALVLALAAQAALEPPARAGLVGVILYAMAAAWLVWAFWRGEWTVAAAPEVEVRSDPFTLRAMPFVLGLALSGLAFVAFQGNRFTLVNVTLLLAALGSLGWAFWRSVPGQPTLWDRARAYFTRRPFAITISGWTLLILAGLALAVFFRVYRLEQVPSQMVSDHAEKLFDIYDVLHGQPSIFFARNTGREAFQMYLTAAIISLFGTGYTFLSLKLGTITCGLLTLPYIYLLGKEIANRRVGWLAMTFAGIAYWPNLISRIALRFTLYPFFFAPALYYLLRGIRTSNRNDYILAGIFLGLGLHGYSPFRVVPFVIVIAVGFFLLHRSSAAVRKQAVFGLSLVTLFSVVVFLPLLRYITELDHPSQWQMFFYRGLTRIAGVEQPLPGPAWLIFFKNLWNAVTMFAWDNGEVWVISITHRPILELISGALFHLGVVLLLVRYLRRRHWLDLFLLVSIPLLEMPSILSLAFPNENPSLNRTAGALVPVFLIIGLSLDGLMTTITSWLKTAWGPRLAWAVALILLFWSCQNNYDLVFNQYVKVYDYSSWNTTEIGGAIRKFVDLTGSEDTNWLVAYPYWVDSRLVMLNAGFPYKDNALWPDHFADTLNFAGPKLFILNPRDTADLDALRQLYPQGWLQTYKSKFETKDFWMFMVVPVK